MDGFAPGWSDEAGSAAGPSAGHHAFVPHGGSGPANVDGFGVSMLPNGQPIFDTPGGKDLHWLLAQRLGPEFVATRSGPGGGKLNYVEGHKAIELINDVLGFNNWRNEVRQVDIDVVDQDETSGKWTVGVSVTVRITLRDGSYREDIGYGTGENQKSKVDAVQKVRG